MAAGYTAEDIYSYGGGSSGDRKCGVFKGTLGFVCCRMVEAVARRAAAVVSETIWKGPNPPPVLTEPQLLEIFFDALGTV